MKTKSLLNWAPLVAALLAAPLSICQTFGAAREYIFSGPLLTGRFIVEAYTRPTPICETCSDELVTNFVGFPYVFSANLGALSCATTNFTLVVKNQDVVFGRSDVYSLLAGRYDPDLGWVDLDMELALMGGSLFNPYTSTLPHDLEAYGGLHYLRIRNPETGEWVVSPIDSLLAVPVLSVERASGGLVLRWPVSTVRFFLEATTSLSPAAEWTEVTEPVEVVGGSFLITIALDKPARFFRLRWSQ